MVWNTIAHPKMMFGGPTPSDDMPEFVVEGIKYADPHKLAFFDLLVDATDGNNPKPVHGDFEIIKNKILNHELVVGGEIAYGASPDGNVSGPAIIIGDSISYDKNSNTIILDVPIASGSREYVISSDNAIVS